MTVELRRVLLAGFVGAALALAACGGGDDPGPGPGPDPDGDTCISDSDCPDENLFYCDTNTSQCVPSCRTAEDCSAEKRGEFALDYCTGTLGCACDIGPRGGQCVSARCSADSECGSNVCRNGECVAPPAATTVAKCQVIPDYVVASVGSKVKFHVSAWTGANEPVVVKDNITWSAQDAAVAVSGAANGTSAEFNVGATTTGAATAVRASVGTINCEAKVLALGPVTAGSIRAVVTDELTGRPISGATLLVTQGAGATQVGTTDVTDANGVAEVTGVGAIPTVTASVFHNDYNYLTIAGYETAGSRSLAFVLRRNQVDNYGGYKGTLNNVPPSANVHAGIAGLSIAGAIADLSFTQLLGDTVPTDVVIGSAVNQQDVPLPAGAYLKFNTSDIKTQISAQGLAGTCTSALSGVGDVETAITTGKCGTRTAWALTADVPIADLPISAFTGGLENIDYGEVLSQAIPILRRFNSSVVRDVEFSLKATPGASSASPNFDDTSHFTTQNMEFAQLPLAFGFAAKVPALPSFRGTPVDSVILLGGANVPGRGVVPLGLGAGVNENKDTSADAQEPSNTAGVVGVRMAPTHHGLEGSEYGLVASATSLAATTDPSVGLAISTIYHRFENNKLTFDPRGDAPITINGPFPAIPENAKYDFVARTFSFTSLPTLTGQTVIRVRFTDRFEHTWTVLFDAADAAGGFTLPEPPGAFPDRTYAAHNSNGTRSLLNVQSMKLGQGADPVTFTELVEHNSTNADRLTDYTQAFSVQDYARPFVEFITPASSGGTLTVGSSLVVDVGFFKIGTDAAAEGGVKFSFTGGTGTCTPVTVTTYSSATKGEVTTQMPACTGSVTIRAELVDKAGAAIVPVAASEITKTVN